MSNLEAQTNVSMQVFRPKNVDKTYIDAGRTCKLMRHERPQIQQGFNKPRSFLL